MIVNARFGNTPWTALAQGMAHHSTLNVGTATIVVSCAVLLLWVPLREPPGIGTVLNTFVVGAVLEVVLAQLPDHSGTAVRVGELIAGILVIAVGNGLYLAARLGPGTRDGLMTALHRRTGASLRVIRTALEGTALITGAILGGQVGIGTIAFALTIGPGMQYALRTFEQPTRWRHRRTPAPPDLYFQRNDPPNADPA
jgi:uncharacterized membrane protein YczE